MIVIQVDGLEPKDVTPQTTPFLWALGHAGGDPSIPLSNGGALAGRDGFSWQAGRGPMAAGTAPAVAALLSGGYPQQTGIPADAFSGDPRSPGKVFSLAADPSSDLFERITDENLTNGAKLYPELLQTQVAGARAGVVLGDPALAGLFENMETPALPYLYPGAPDWGGSPGNPSFCSAPADPTVQPDSPPACPADDADTMNQAAQKLVGAGTDKISFAYIELAGVGATKRLNGDVDSFTTGQSGDGGTPSNPNQAVQQALHDMDVAINQFAQRYAQDSAAKLKWASTVLMVVGDHGYEATPTAHRIPDPDDPTNAQKDLSDYVPSQQFRLVPQGSFATVYYTGGGDTQAKWDALKLLRTSMLAQVNATSQCAPPAGPCLTDDGVLFTHPDPTATDPAAATANTVGKLHPDWHLDALDGTGAPIGVSGDMVIAAPPGWAIGRSVPGVDAFNTGPVPATNPYNASDQGPRNRAIAAIVNGPTGVVRPWSVPAATDTTHAPLYPVASTAVPEASCPTSPAAATTDVDVANAAPSDDANTPGHECQPELVDFAPTIAAFMHVSVPPTQIAGRFLQEAFKQDLVPVREEQDLGQADEQQDPPPPAQDIYVPPPPPPPPPPPGFDYYGLLRDLRARVVDAKGCTWGQAKRGSKLDYLKIEGDFGKPLESVTLTFYRKLDPAKDSRKRRTRTSRAAWSWVRSAAVAAAKCGATPARVSVTGAGTPRSPLRVKTVAQFKAFTVKRGHVVLKLLVPDQFAPDHVGVVVREARRIQVSGKDKDGNPLPNFRAFGTRAGGVFAIADAVRLHAIKGAKRKAQR